MLRRFNCKWSREKQWLQYSPRRNGGICLPSVLFGFLDFHFSLCIHTQSNSPATFHFIILSISSASKKAIIHIHNEDFGLVICQRELTTRKTIQKAVAALFYIHFIGALQYAALTVLIYLNITLDCNLKVNCLAQ